MDEEEIEVVINIQPKMDRLEELGITKEEFEEALDRATDERYEATKKTTDPNAIPFLEEMKLHIKGRTFVLEDIADIQISGDVDLLNE